MDPSKSSPVSVISTRRFDSISTIEENPSSISYTTYNHAGAWDTSLNDFDITDKSIRLGFLRKIYGILTLQLILTFGIVAFVTFQDGVKKVFQDYVLYFTIIPLTLVAALTILVFVKKSLSKMIPINFIILAAFTVLTTIAVSAVASYFEGVLVLAAGGITLFVTLSTFLYTLQSKWNINFWGGLILTLFIGVLSSVILYFCLPEKEVTGYKIWAIIGVSLLLTTYIAVMIFGTMEEYFGFSFKPEEYIQAIFKIYLGTLIVFLIVLLILAVVAGDGKCCEGSSHGSGRNMCVGCYWGTCYSGGAGSRNDSDDEDNA